VGGMKEPTVGYRLEWNDQIVKSVNAVERRAKVEIGKRLVVESNRRVPRDTGALQASGKVSSGGARVTYGGGTTYYAVVLHAHPEWNYQDGRSGTWFEEGVERTANEVERIYGGELRKVISE
jgi:hypothetical protein